MLRFLRSPLAWLIAVLFALAVGISFWQISKQQRLERERLADEQQELRRVAESENRRKREQQRLEQELQAQKETDEKLRQMEIEFRQDELKRKQFTAGDRPSAPASNSYQWTSEEIRRRDTEQRQQYEDEAAMHRARADIERQRRELEQRQYEEQAGRAQRDSGARASSTTTAPPSEPTESSPVPPRVRPPVPKKTP